MARRPADYTAQMQAAEERRRLQEEKQREEQQREHLLLERQASSYGQVVLDIMGARTTIDALAGLLLESRERAKANPQLGAEWAARGFAYFRPAGNGQRKQPAEPKGAAGNGSPPDKPPAPEPARPRPASASGGQDLLGGLASDRPGTGTPGEGGSRGEHA